MNNHVGIKSEIERGGTTKGIKNLITETQFSINEPFAKISYEYRNVFLSYTEDVNDEANNEVEYIINNEYQEVSESDLRLLQDKLYEELKNHNSYNEPKHPSYYEGTKIIFS